MNLVIKLNLKGKKKKRIYQIMVTKKNKKRNTPSLSKIGTFIPFSQNNYKILSLNLKKFKYWLSKGAKPNLTVKKILNKFILSYKFTDKNA